MNPSECQVLLCGHWDGINLWAQWSGLPSENGYRIEVRYRPPEKEWRDWLPFSPRLPFKKQWAVIPTWHEGWDAQARVGIFGGGEWALAQEVTFLRSRCLFEFSSAAKPLHFIPPVEISARVDGAVCTYRLDEEIILEPGETQQATLTAARLTGYSQLDHPGHFELRPNRGVLIRNTEPSVDDVQPTGRDFATLKALPFQAVKIVVG